MARVTRNAMTKVLLQPIVLLVSTLLSQLFIPTIAQSCTVCPDAQSLRDESLLLNAETFQTYNATTCGDLAASEALTNAQGDLCASIQISIGIGQCQCDPFEGTCSVCPDGTPLIAPQARIADTNTGATCLDVAEFAAGADASIPGACDVYHLSAFVCGCPPIEGGCSLCAAGEAVPNPDETVDFSTGETCGQLEERVPFVDAGSAYCRAPQRAAALYCGCEFVPQPGVCTVCPNGSLVPDPFLEFRNKFSGTNTTCGQFSVLASFETNVEDCANIHGVGASECGCESLGDQSCTLCSDGSSPTKLDGFLMGADGQVITCQDLTSLAPFVAPGTEACNNLQAIAATVCGCPSINRSGGCSICPLGELVSDPNLPVIGTTTCGVADILASQDSSGTCGRYHLFAEPCGCVLPLNRCTLCAEGTLAPFPDAIVTFAGTSPLGPLTCSEYEDRLLFVDPEDVETCKTGQVTGFFTCGCLAVPLPRDDPVCELCAAPVNAATIIPNPDDPFLRPVTCKQASSLVGYTTTEDNCQTVEETRSLCGCPSTECFLCRDGSPPHLLDAVVEIDGISMTCAELDEMTKSTTVEPEACLAIQDAGIYACYCEDAPNSCLLCEDGSALPDPDLVVVPGFTCARTEFFARTDSLDQCPAYRSTVGVYCGCVNPIASEGACRICGGNTLLPDINVVFKVDSKTTTCGERELDAATSENCSDLQTLYAPFCCPSDPPGDSGAGEGFTGRLVLAIALLLHLAENQRE